MQDRDAPTLGPTRVIAPRRSKRFVCAAQDACENADAVPEERRIQRMVDVRLDHGRVRTHPAPVLNLLLLRIEQERLVDGFPRLGTNRADVGLKCRLLRRRRGRRQPAEGSKLKGVSEMKGQLVVAHVEHLLEEACPHDLLGRQTFPPFLHADLPTARQIMPYRCKRQCRRVEHAAHLQELRCARMLRHDGRERKLVVVESPHRGASSFFGGIGVFPEETDGPSILFSIADDEILVCLRQLAVPGRELVREHSTGRVKPRLNIRVKCAVRTTETIKRKNASA